MTPEERYRQAIVDRNFRQQTGVEDLSGPIAPGVGREAIDKAVKDGVADRQGNALEAKAQEASVSTGVNSAASKAGSQMVQNGSQGGDPAQMISGAAMMSGNPYLMAGGLGLSVLAAGEKNKRQQEELQRQEYTERIKNRQVLMSQIASQGIQ
jgi:hypothetical protein